MATAAVTIDPGETYTCAFSATITGDHKNTATAKVKDDLGSTGTRSAKASVDVEEPPPSVPPNTRIGNLGPLIQAAAATAAENRANAAAVAAASPALASAAPIRPPSTGDGGLIWDSGCQQ